eukprot:scaffold3421_cov181-Amphora_coffeaeformis.AAC.7
MKNQALRLLSTAIAWIAFWSLCPLLESSTAAAVPTTTRASSTPLLSWTDACAHNNNDTVTTARSRYSALACWLQELKIPIPDQTFHEGILTLSLKDFVCSNFSLVGLDSSYRPSAVSIEQNPSLDPQLEISLRNVSAICRGTYHSSPWSGKVEAAVGPRHADTPALRFIWNVSSALKNHSFPQPDKIHTTDCQTEIAVQDLQFSGSMSAKTIQIFVKQIRSSVTKALSTQMCPLVSSILEPTFDHYIQMINNWLEPYLSDDETELGQSQRSKQVSTSTDLSFEKTANDRLPAWLGSEKDKSLERNLLDRHHSPKKKAMKWSRDAPALVGSLRILNNGLQYFLQKGILRNWLPIFDDKNHPHSCGFFFDGINSLIRSILYDNQGWMDLPLLSRWEHLHFVIPHYAAIQLQIKNISVHGLDHFDTLQLFTPGDEESFVTRLDSHNVTFRTRLQLVLSAVPDGVFKGDDLKEDFLVDFNATKLDTMLRFYLNADKASLHDKVTVGTVWDVLEGVISRNSTLPQLPCLLESIDSFLVSNISALWQLESLSFIPDFNGKVVTDNLEADLDRLLNNAMQVVWSEFPEMVTQSINGLAKGPVVDYLNAFFERITATNETCTVPHHQNYIPHPIDFSNVGWLQHMNDFFARSSTRRHIDSYLQCGADYLTEALLERIPMSLIRIRSFAFRNLGHLQDLKFLSPLADGRTLRNAFRFGTNDTSSLPQLHIEMDAELPQGSAALNLTLEWNEVDGSSGLTLDYDLGRLKQYPLPQVLGRGECLLVPTNELHSYDVTSQLDSFSVYLSAAVMYGAENTVHLNWTSTDTPEVKAVASAFWAWVANSTRDMTNLVTVAAMSKAHSLCQGKKPSYDEHGSDEDYLSISLVVCAIILLAQPAVLMLQNENDNNRDLRRQLEEQEQYENALMQPLLTDADLSTPGLYTRGGGPKRGLIEHENVPDVVRIIVPILIVCTIVILGCSNLAVGADVKLEATIEGQIFTFPSLFSFSLYNTAKEMLQARIYSLLILVAVFSGFWPYLKLCLMLFGWLKRFSPRDVRRRGRMFLALDALGKFSLVDTYVLVLMVVAFRYHLELEGGVKVDVYVDPQFGFYGFLVGTILSLVLSHTLVFYHRSAEASLPPRSCEKATPLCKHAFQTANGRRQFSMRTKMLMLCAFVFTLVMLVIGMFQESFIFEFGGVAGELIGQRKDAAYSLISLGKSLPESVEKSSMLAIGGLQTAYFFFAVAAPIACLFFLCILFALPLTLRYQFVLLTCAEIANAWSAIEVFCLSIVAALLEISTFASFIVGDKCDLIDSILQNDFKEVADTCYSVAASVSWSAAYLVIGVVLNSFVVSVALRFAHTAMDERIVRGTIDTDSIDSLSSPQATLIEKVASCKGMGWILSATTEDGQGQIDLPVNSDDISPLQRLDHDGTNVDHPNEGIAEENEVGASQGS